MQQIVSIKKEDRYLKIVVIEKIFFSWVLKAVHCIRLDTDDLDSISEIKKQINKNAILVFSLAAIDTLQKKISFPDISWVKIKKLIPFQIESIFPLGTEGLVVKPFFKKGKKEKEVFFQAVSEKLVKTKLQEILDLGIDPSYVAFDNVTYLKIIESSNFQNDGVYIHLNELETVIIFFEKNVIREQIFLDIGFSSLTENLIQKSKVLSEIEKILRFKKKENLPIFLGGFFVFIEDIFNFFANAAFINADKQQTLLFLEITQAKFYNFFNPTMINLSLFGSSKKIKKEQIQSNQLKKIFWSVMACFFITITGLNLSIDGKLKQVLKIYNEKKFENYQSNIPIILDIKRHPASITSVLNTIEETVTKNSTKLVSCLYKLEKYPQFKSPTIPFLIKINLSIDGTDKNTQTVIKELKKLASIDLKKGIKLEKKHDQQNLEFYIK